MKKWFDGCKTTEDVKKRYRDLCKEHHPDLHPGEASEEAMKQINAEYDVVWARYKGIHATANKGKANGNAEKTGTSDYNEAPEEFKNIISAIIACEGIEIELVGRWIWVTGNTYACKDTLKSVGFRWANKKQAWYWHPADEYAKHSHMSFDDIKQRYGCQAFGGKVQPRLA